MKQVIADVIVDVCGTLINLIKKEPRVSQDRAALYSFVESINDLLDANAIEAAGIGFTVVNGQVTHEEIVSLLQSSDSRDGQSQFIKELLSATDFQFLDILILVLTTATEDALRRVTNGYFILEFRKQNLHEFTH